MKMNIIPDYSRPTHFDLSVFFHYLIVSINAVFEESNDYILIPIQVISLPAYCPWLYRIKAYMYLQEETVNNFSSAKVGRYNCIT